MSQKLLDRVQTLVAGWVHFAADFALQFKHQRVVHTFITQSDTQITQTCLLSGLIGGRYIYPERCWNIRPLFFNPFNVVIELEQEIFAQNLCQTDRESLRPIS